MKIGVVVPAYGPEVLGGAETAARRIAEHLAARGEQVEVFTTCAVSSQDWADHYRPGTVEVNGVTVHRQRARSGRAADFDAQSRPVLANPPAVPNAVGERWLEAQGPYCPDTLDALLDAAVDVTLLSPYLFWPTVHGVRRLGPRAVLLPAAHDERPARLPLYREMFERAGGLALFTASEQRLVHRLFPGTRPRRQEVLGVGVDPGSGDAAAARAAVGVGDRPFLLCLGRVDRGKGAALLAGWFAAYKRRRPGPLALVLAGPLHQALAAQPEVLMAGRVSDSVKWGLLAGAEVLVNPSPHESLSLVLLEGWLAGLPALVNGACPVTVDHCRLSGGGLAFDGYAGFEVALDRLVGDPELRRALGGAGRAYVERHYGWDRVTARYQAFLGHVARLAPRR